ncbi:PREDICTED: uncharacterized protein LOC106810687 isoform X2 [Priapulus caudatus]|uniref:Uncharacterized protein LOC106810687 isoform X2 n=1 Tax=Priapulus caudatus TaxID=37621 RepID=A0ABM1EBN5_PRICU|nr:PREDICTED: uncharacterized protein LOC106810687 isoform X2 [Priapulus caudatus]
MKLLAESGKERDIMKEVDDLVEKMAHLREQLRDLTHSNDQQKRVFATKQQKMSKMAIKHRQQIEALQYQLEEHKKTLEEHARRCKENDVLTLKFTEEKMNVDQALAIQKKSHEKVLAKYMQQYHELIAAVKQYHNTLLDAITS